MTHKSLYSLALCSLLLASCSDKDIDNGQPLPAGTEIQFGSTLDSELDSRTYYDPEDVANPNATAWKIYWNYQANDLDKIFIYSPEAAGNRNQATYTVDPEGEKKYQATKVTKDSPAGIQTGDAQGDYHFYALYPASVVDEAASNSKISGTFNGRQNAIYMGTTTENNGTVHNFDADMDLCLMTAVQTVSAANLSKPVSLQFKPFATVLNVEVNGPTTGATANITSVVIKSDQQICGKFSVDFSTGTPVCNVIPSSTESGDNSGDNNIYVSTLNNEGMGITLNTNDKLKVRAFLLPNTNVKNLKVEVNGTVKDGNNPTKRGTWTKTLAISNFKPSMIQTCRLPKLNTNPDGFDKATWISQLPMNTYLSEISLPGSALAFNYLLTDEEAQGTPASKRAIKQNKTQSLNFRDQIKAGSRVLQAHITYDSDSDPAVYMANSDGGMIPYTNGNLKLIDVVDALVAEMGANHGNEFCVLSLSDYLTGNTKTVAALYTKLKDVLSTDRFKGKIVTSFGPETTLFDVKDKVLIKLSLNTGRAYSSMQNINGADVMFNTWGDDAGSHIRYSPLTFKTIPAQNSLGGSSSSGSVSSWNMAFIYSEQANPTTGDGATEPSYVSTVSLRSLVNAYTGAYDKSSHKVFGMTYLGGTGYSSRHGVLNPTTTTITPTDVTVHFISSWNSAVANVTDKPYGWVLFNMVGSGNTTIDEAVSKVINHNDPNKLAQKPASRTHTGNASILNGGQLN